MFGRVSYCLNVVAAFSVGYQYDEWRNLSNEIRQGGNYTLASLTQAAQTLTIYWCTQKIFSSLISGIRSPYLRLPLKGVTQILGGQFSILIIPFLATIKTGDYPSLYQSVAKVENAIFAFFIRLFPKKFSPNTIEKIGYFLDHFGFFADGAMFLNLVGLFLLNEKLYSAMIISGVIFNRLFRSHYIPLGVREVMERQASLFINLSNLGNESWNAKLQGFLSLVNRVRILRIKADKYHLEFLEKRAKKYIFEFFISKSSAPPEKKAKTLKKLEKLLQSSLRLADIEAPLKQRKDLSFEEFLAILTSDTIEFNLIHFSKSFEEKPPLPEDQDFAQIQTAFDSINWNECLNVISQKCKKDDRFILYLAGICSGSELMSAEVNYPLYRNQFDSYLDQAARKAGIFSSQFLLNWVKAQMEIFMQILSGKRGFPGTAFEERQWINNLKKIVYFLKNGSPTQTERQDLLLSLAIEGGGYCGTGLLDCSEEIINLLVHKAKLQQQPNSKLDKFAEFEKTFYRDFEDKRKAISLECTLALMGLHPQGFKVASFSTHDRHYYRFINPPLSMGFSPLTPEEMDQFSLIQLVIFWGMRSLGVFYLFKFLQYKHSYYDLLDGNSKYNDIVIYICDVINNNDKLENWQKTFLLYLLMGDYNEQEFQEQHSVSKDVLKLLSEFTSTYQKKDPIKSLAPHRKSDAANFQNVMNKTSKQRRKIDVLFGVILGILKCPEVKKLA